MSIIADYTVIADVGHSLVKLLREHLCPHPISQQEHVGLASPEDKGDLSLCLYLYNVAEDGEARQPGLVRRGLANQQFPPLMLKLSYLLVPYSAAELQSRALDEQLILGKALQVVYDNAILRGSALHGSLGAAGEEIRLVLDPIPPESLRELWTFSDMPYKLCVSLTVSAVRLDSTRTKTAPRVLERDIRLSEKEDEQ